MALADQLHSAHAVVSPGDPGQSPVDSASAGQGPARRIVLSSPGVAANLAVDAECDRVAAVTRRLSVVLSGGRVASPLPVAVQEFDQGLIWHPRIEAAPALHRLREAIASLVARAGVRS